MLNASHVKRSFRIRLSDVFGKLLHSKVKRKLISFFTASDAEPSPSITSKPNTTLSETEEMKIRYFGDLATIEIFIPKYLGVWLENQATLRKISVRAMVKEWLLEIYRKHAQKITK